MAYTMEDFLRETHEMVLEEALKRRDPEDILKHYDAEDRLRGLDPEERLRGLDPAIIKAWLAKQSNRQLSGVIASPAPIC